MFCQQCGAEIVNTAVVCVKCGSATGVKIQTSYAKSRVAFILLGLFLGGLGIHNFYAGYTGRGIAQLLITIFVGWLILPLLAVGLWILIEVIVVDSDSSGQKMT